MHAATGTCTEGQAIANSDAQQLEQLQRANAYLLLAALLRALPTPDLLTQIAALHNLDNQTEPNELAQAMAELGQQAAACTEALAFRALDDEYHALFIGLGRGEIVPYGSWYLTGFLMEKPLAVLRNDLAQLGFTREDDVCEPEDHAAALCEVMALLIQEQHPTSTQYRFFFQHLAPWLPRFFKDLDIAPSSKFYQVVAHFGAAFIAFETQYFGLEIQE